MELILDNDYPITKRTPPEGEVVITPADFSESEDETPKKATKPKKK